MMRDDRAPKITAGRGCDLMTELHASIRNLPMIRAAACMFALLAAPAFAAPPPMDSDDWNLMAPYAGWITSQRTPDGKICCSVADARPVDARIVGHHWQVHFLHPETLSDDAVKPPPADWVDVPDSAVLHGFNPSLQPLAWWYSGVVRCFSPPGGV